MLCCVGGDDDGGVELDAAVVGGGGGGGGDSGWLASLSSEEMQVKWGFVVEYEEEITKFSVYYLFNRVVVPT